MTLAGDIPTVDTVADMIRLLQTANPNAKFRVSPGLMLIKEDDGTVRIDDGKINA